MPNTSGLGDSEQTTTDMLEITVDSHKEGHDALTQLAVNAIESSPTCDEVASGVWSIAEAENFHLSDALKDYFELLVDDIDSRDLKGAVIVTLVQSALSDVDWHELADTYIRRVKENA